VRRAYRSSLVEAVRMAYAHLEGDFAFVVAHREQPGLLVGTRRRCPLHVPNSGHGQSDRIGTFRRTLRARPRRRGRCRRTLVVTSTEE
jgi:glucosamine 6-phosphate synthetase-like amidotransferase/phosphosugar isomerase protein